MNRLCTNFLWVALMGMLLPTDVSVAADSGAVMIHPDFETTPGVYVTQVGRCPISMTISGMGGFTVLVLPSQGKKTRNIEDVTGVAYLPSDALIVTVSPMYGRPGIYRYDCLSQQLKQLVRPRTINKGYPDGADYFELQDARGETLYLYYSPDITATDFERFRSPDYLYEVHTDGTGFRKVQQ